MIFQKLLAFAARRISSLFRLTHMYNPYTDANGKELVNEDHLSTGPRLLVIRNGKVLRLCGLFNIVIVAERSGDDYRAKPIVSCHFFYFTIQPGDEVCIGKSALRKYNELNPPQPYHEPMFQDGSGCSFG